MFLQHQGRTSSKTSLFTLFFNECVENTVFCDVFSTRGFKCTANTTVFFIFLLVLCLSYDKKARREHEKKSAPSTSFEAMVGRSSWADTLFVWFPAAWMPLVVEAVRGRTVTWLQRNHHQGAKTLVFTVFWQDPHAKKHDVLKHFFTIFQLLLLHSKNDHFLLYSCHCSSGLEKVLNRLLNCP